MPLIMSGLGAAAATGAAGIIGDVISSGSAGAANRTNEQINNTNIGATRTNQFNAERFNAEQAAVGRAFSAQQVRTANKIQEEEFEQSQAYDTRMSDTAMQRRMADLRAAGINPLLAVSQGGASTPTVSAGNPNAASASTAQISPASRPGSIPMQATGQAFGNLGGILNGAIEASKANASIDLMQAQAQKTRKEAGAPLDAQTEYVQSLTGLNSVNAKQAGANIKLIGEQAVKTQKEGMNADIQGQILQQNADVQRATLDSLISITNSEAAAKRLGLPGLQNQSDIEKSNLGQYINWLNKILQPVGTAVGVAKGLAGGGGGGGMTINNHNY